MATRHLGSCPDLIDRLQAYGDAGADIVRRLAEADEMIARADATCGFTHVSQRQKARLLGAEGRRLFNQAISDATTILNNQNQKDDDPQGTG